MSEILVIGSLNMDLVVTTPKIPVIGESILGSGFFTTPGGKGANQAIAASRLGGDVSIIGSVGDDLFGHNLIENLKKNNVNVDNIYVTDKCSTGVALIVLKDGDNFIICDPGANLMLFHETVDSLEKAIKKCKILVLQLEIPFDTVIEAIKIAGKHNVKVLLDPAPSRELPEYLFSMIDILKPNEIECEYLTGIPIKSIEDAKKSARYLLKKGVKQVVITLGGRGVVYNDGKDIVHKPAHNIKVVDTTAAGDSFSGALALSIARGIDINDAIDFANIVGSLTVTKKGAQSSLPTLDDIKNFSNNPHSSF